jgi:hypothetical protein
VPIGVRNENLARRGGLLRFSAHCATGVLAMVRIVCPGCASKLNAKDELIGQVRNCPKCGRSVRIVAEINLDEMSILADADTPAVPDTPAIEESMPAETTTSPPQGGLVKPNVPKRLNRESHYLICGRTQLAAAWTNNGQGWLLKTDAGLVNAKRNSDNIPSEGDFKLVELKLEITADGRRLSGLRIYQLAPRWALLALTHDDDQITEKITGPGALNREQKFVIRQALKDQFMRPVWENAAAVLEYLANTDYHSNEIG